VESEQGILPGCRVVAPSAGAQEAGANKAEESRAAKPRYEAINRQQLCWRAVDVERLIGEEHRARAIWEFVGQLDLSRYIRIWIRLRWRQVATAATVPA
jgi:hypothetical protein